MADAWTWVARYDDGSCIAELDPHGDHGFADVELERVRAFELHPADPESGLSTFCILIDPLRGQVPIFFRTRATEWLLAGGESETLHTCIGRREGDVETYIYCDDTRRVVIADRRLG